VLEELQPGDPVQVGPYRLTGVLGTGGMGRVFLGWSSGGRPLAVKVIKPELAGDPEFRARFRREVAAARTISGLYTALLIDTDTDGPVPWLATAYVDGPSLNEAVSGYGPLPAESVLALASGLAEALTAVHAMGLVHRDLKPSNVLLASDGPRVIDFGISRAADTTTLTNTGQSIGSPGFLSPEQAVGSEVGPLSDIFSLGAVLAFAASGNSPFGIGAPHALIYRVVHEPPALDGIPAELRPLITRCLAKEPGDRPAASDLLAELTDVRPGARWLPERITAALAAFAVPAPPAAVAAGHERTATAATQPPPPPPPAAAAAARGARRSPWRRRGLLVPVAAAVAVLAAAGIALAATSGGAGQPDAFKGGGPTVSASPVAARSHQATSAVGTPRPAHSKSVKPKRATSHKTSHKAVATQRTAPAQATPSVVIVTEAPTTQASAPVPKPSSAPPKPKPKPSPAGPSCSFIVNGALSCDSTNPTVSLYGYFEDDTSACTFTRDITWGDGTSSVVVVQGGPAGPKYVTSHTYAAPGTYSIYFGSESVEGACTDAVLTYTFQLLPG
jgi:Protein kinase domain